jgi:hypothetical protein
VPGAEICPDGGFPTVNRPVLVSMSIEDRTSDGRTSMRRLEGFAADGVAEIALVGIDGGVIGSTIARRNTFAIPVAGRPLTQSVLIARDSRGNEVYRQTL